MLLVWLSGFAADCWGLSVLSFVKSVLGSIVLEGLVHLN